MNPTKNLIEANLYMNPTKNKIELKHYMNPTKNLIDAKLYMNPTKNLIEDKLYMNPNQTQRALQGNREGASCSIRLYKVTEKEQVVVLGFTR